MSQGGKTRYRIQLQNGNTFVFEQVGRGWQIRDGFGGNRPANREAALGSAITHLLNARFQ
jgi:hypothetical protein